MQPQTMIVRWQVPGLVERPVVGTTCCASTAEAIVVQEMCLLAGVEDVAVDCAAGTVEVTYEPAKVTEGEIAAALAEIGYPPQSS